MVKSFIKKQEKKLNPGYRTSDFYKGKTFGGKNAFANRSNYKQQHKG